MQRRDLLKSIGVIGGVWALAGGLDAYVRGVRFPNLQGEPDSRPTHLDWMEPDLQLDLEGAFIQNVERLGAGLRIEIRAFVPEPQISFSAEDTQSHQILVHNISHQAGLESGDITLLGYSESAPTSRVIDLQLPAGQHNLKWRVPFTSSFRFTTIGDSGGGSELAWCLQRSEELGADFVLHAGDIYYDENDFNKISGVLQASPLPIYAAIGNHDFHGGGVDIHLNFTQEIGPRNFYFRLDNTVFVSFDTAASTWPVDHGDRAALFEKLNSLEEPVKQWVLLTHRPIHDPRYAADSKKSHTVSDFEKDWLLKQLKQLDPQPELLAGHIHIAAEHLEDGLKTYISGDGLGSRDLVSGGRVARILLGEKGIDSKVNYDWQPLNMPYEYYCHGKNLGVLAKSGKSAPDEAFGAQCG
ncbi:MAG: hypothetical protein ACI8P9_002361 [Parasphingorhabdus sp.]|jgi:hypothetical protein